MKDTFSLACVVLLVTCLFAADATAQSADSVLHVQQQDGTTLMRLNSDGGFVLQGSDTGVLPATGPGRRFMWIPSLGAIRAGEVGGEGATYWDLSNIGAGSVAFGENNRADGRNSFATGLSTRAAGQESVALGNGSTASGNRAFAFNGTASGAYAIAIGNGAQATGVESIALGFSAIAEGLASLAVGQSVAHGTFGVAIGQQNSASGNYSVAIGKNARTANRSGAIVLGDACAVFTSDSIYPTANNQFVVRGCGGLRMYTSRDLSAGVQVAAGGNSWSAVSDRNRKENFKPMDGEEVLRRLREVEVSSWNYLTQEHAIRHAGPMAQDFHAAFGLGESDLLINSIDIDGVNMAAAKGLDARTLAQQARIEALEAEVAALRGLVETLIGRE